MQVSSWPHACPCGSSQASKYKLETYRDAQDRMFCKDKTCLAHIQLIMSWKAMLLLIIVITIIIIIISTSIMSSIVITIVTVTMMIIIITIIALVLVVVKLEN